MNKEFSDIDLYFAQADSWRDEQIALRNILLDCDLVEAIKWRQPCYSYEGTNLIIIGPQKSGCTLSFFKGALLKDEQGILEKPGEFTRAGRVIRFVSIEEIAKLEPVLKSYIYESIELAKTGARVDFSESADLPMPDELVDMLDEQPEFAEAFFALTPGRQRGYVLYFSSAKNASTRRSRIEKYLPRILDGKGLNDCTCGLSKKMPACDGSHKSLH